MNIGVIFAGGVGKRMNSRVKPKQFLNVYGKPIIIHTLEVFDSHPDIDAIVVACLEEWIPYLQELIEKRQEWTGVYLSWLTGSEAGRWAGKIYSIDS